MIITYTPSGGKEKLTIPTLLGSYIYTGSAITPAFSSYDPTKITIGGTYSATIAGTYTATFTPNSGCVWSDNTSDTKNVSWSIGIKSLPIPTITGSYIYSGSSQTVGINNFNSTFENVSGNTYTNAGTYTATVSLKDTTSTQWSDGTTASKSLSWTIAKAPGSVTITPDTVTLSSSYIGTTQRITYAIVGNGGSSFGSKNNSVVGVTGVSFADHWMDCTINAVGDTIVYVSSIEGTNYTGSVGYCVFRITS